MRKGFSLIELLVTLAVISIAILAIYEVFLFTLKTTRQARNVTYAYQAAEEEREIIKNTAFSSLVNQSGGSFLDQTQSLSRLPDGQGQLTIEDYNGDSKVKKILVRVLWLESNGTKEYTLTTLRIADF